MKHALNSSFSKSFDKRRLNNVNYYETVHILAVFAQVFIFFRVRTKLKPRKECISLHSSVFAFRMRESKKNITRSLLQRRSISLSLSFGRKTTINAKRYYHDFISEVSQEHSRLCSNLTRIPISARCTICIRLPTKWCLKCDPKCHSWENLGNWLKHAEISGSRVTKVVLIAKVLGKIKGTSVIAASYGTSRTDDRI